jgi:predicted nucleotidyltransferase
MNGKTAIPLPMDKLEAFCQKWQIIELALFGSILREDFRPDSDVDFLVTFAQEAKRSLFDIVDMKDELEAMLGRVVDVVNRAGIERSKNYIRRKAIFESAEVIYVAA